MARTNGGYTPESRMPSSKYPNPRITLDPARESEDFERCFGHDDPRFFNDYLYYDFPVYEDNQSLSSKDLERFDEDLVYAPFPRFVHDFETKLALLYYFNENAVHEESDRLQILADFLSINQRYFPLADEEGEIGRLTSKQRAAQMLFFCEFLPLYENITPSIDMRSLYEEAERRQQNGDSRLTQSLELIQLLVQDPRVFIGMSISTLDSVQDEVLACSLKKEIKDACVAIARLSKTQYSGITETDGADILSLIAFMQDSRYLLTSPTQLDFHTIIERQLAEAADQARPSFELPGLMQALEKDRSILPWQAHSLLNATTGMRPEAENKREGDSTRRIAKRGKVAGPKEAKLEQKFELSEMLITDIVNCETNIERNQIFRSAMLNDPRGLIEIVQNSDQLGNWNIANFNRIPLDIRTLLLFMTGRDVELNLLINNEIEMLFEPVRTGLDEGARKNLTTISSAINKLVGLVPDALQQIQEYQNVRLGVVLDEAHPTPKDTNRFSRSLGSNLYTILNKYFPDIEFVTNIHVPTNILNLINIFGAISDFSSGVDAGSFELPKNRNIPNAKIATISYRTQAQEIAAKLIFYCCTGTFTPGVRDRDQFSPKVQYGIFKKQLSSCPSVLSVYVDLGKKLGLN